jgi:hypothetical protein
LFISAQVEAKVPILNEDEVLAFVHTEIGSVWAVELLIFLKAHRERTWALEELVLALRSSSMAVAQAINRLHGAGFIREPSPDSFGFEPRSPAHLEIADAIAKLSAEKPMRLAKAIAEIPNEKLRNFSDAFKFRD